MTASGLGLLMIYTSLLKDSVGTGLTDGFPPGGVDAHDVCLNLHCFLGQLFTPGIGQSICQEASL